MDLLVGHAYYLEGLGRLTWDAPHPRYGTPDRLAGKYLGCLHGARHWHGFEIWIGGREQGVIFMTDEDIVQVQVTDLGETEI